MRVAVIGGGAAGFFAAISVKEHYPGAKVVLLEKSQKLLAKVKVSGGGRCNVTNACTSISELCKAYPRGGKSLKKPFHRFNTVDTVKWFENRGVPLYAQDDGRIFPVSDNSQTIIDCLMRECKRLDISIQTGVNIKTIQQLETGLELSFVKETTAPKGFDKVIIATGGSPKRAGLLWLEDLGHKIEEPIPSLFTFNMPENPITQLMGVSVEKAIVNVQGTKLKSEGPLLVTHWGMSGPAVLKLSAFGARLLHQKNYDFNIQVNWTAEPNNEKVLEVLRNIVAANPKKKIGNIKPYPMPERLWHFLIEKSDLKPNTKWEETGKKALNKLMSVLSNDIYAVRGKTTFKEEFVTCGGVSLQSINMSTMESKSCRNLYFAGEVMDIDAITGGYNFQAAWTTGYIAGKLGGD